MIVRSDASVHGIQGIMLAQSDKSKQKTRYFLMRMAKKEELTSGC